MSVWFEIVRRGVLASAASASLAGAAQAQGIAGAPATSPSAPGAVTPPTTATPPAGAARGVVRPTRRVDQGMVKRPPPHGRPTMPVIRPPGTAR